LKENLALRSRVEQLEALLATSHLPLSSPNNRPPEPPEDIFTTFERLHLGGSEENTIQGTVLEPTIYDDQILSLLPIRESSLKIVHFSLGALGWVHCALDVPRFMTEHDAFWNGLEVNDRKALQNHGWMAVYLSVLAVSLAVTVLIND